MPEITPEQREAAEAVMAEAMAGLGWDGRAWRNEAGLALEALIALGWRAPGPPTEEEVEKAAWAIQAALMGPETWEGTWVDLGDAADLSTCAIGGPVDLTLFARAALTAALGGNPDDNA